MGKGKQRFNSARISHMTYTDMKAACIMRGIPFGEVSKNDFWGLSYWYHQHSHEACDKKLLEEYAEWRRKELIRQGYPQDSALVEFSEFATDDNESSGNLKHSIVRKAAMGKLKETKRRRERDSKFGIFTGTKKAKIFELTEKAMKKGWDKKKCLRKIIELSNKRNYEVSEKSIGIWFKKAWKQLEGKIQIEK